MYFLTFQAYLVGGLGCQRRRFAHMITSTINAIRRPARLAIGMDDLLRVYRGLAKEYK